MFKNCVLSLSFVFFCLQSMAQIEHEFIDSKYLEDQLYIGLTYNLMNNSPTGFSQNGLSSSVSTGFIKDIPINKRRNIGFGIGLGYSYSSFIHNLKISEDSNRTTFEIVDNADFDSNRFLTHSLEIPLELRWRSSTALKYKFWRVYAGVKFGYVLASNSKFSDILETVKVKNINEIRRMQYGATLSVGYATWNLNLYYGFRPIFNNAVVAGEAIDLKLVNIGLIFYIL